MHRGRSAHFTPLGVMTNVGLVRELSIASAAEQAPLAWLAARVVQLSRQLGVVSRYQISIAFENS